MVGMLSDKGTVRSLNEDYADFFEDALRKVYVMADGMGGHNAGEVASKTAVEAIIDFVKSASADDKIETIIVEAIKEANKQIYLKAQNNSELSGMGTTVTACLSKQNELVVANVGDSCCFAVKSDGIVKITKDHSLVQQLVDAGSITEEEALKHPNKNIITRALGTNEDVEVDIFKLKMDEIFKVILCTDGMSNEVSKSEMHEILLNNDNEEACRKLVELSKLKGGRDNISVIIFEGVSGNGRNYTG